MTLGAYASCARVNNRVGRHGSRVDGSSSWLSGRSNRRLAATNRLWAALVAGILAAGIGVAAAVLTERIAATEVAEQLVEQAGLAAGIAGIAGITRIGARIASFDNFATADGLGAARLRLVARIAAIGLATGLAARVIAAAVLLEQVTREELAEQASSVAGIARIARITGIGARIARINCTWVFTYRCASLLATASRFATRHVAPSVATVAGRATTANTKHSVQQVKPKALATETAAKNESHCHHYPLHWSLISLFSNSRFRFAVICQAGEFSG